jgi:hypothetical protein
MLAREFWPSSSTAAARRTADFVGPAKPATRRTASGKMVPVIEPRLGSHARPEPAQPERRDQVRGQRKKHFCRGLGGVIESPREMGGRMVADAGIRQPPPVPPPPPINLKFFGFANRPGETKKVFLSQGEDVFIAAEGDIVDRRYRVLHISPTAVDVEDVLNNNRQSLPLTQG